MAITSDIQGPCAIIDLGSNSFNLVVFSKINHQIQIIQRLRQKVHLAKGLDQDNVLSHKAMQRGWNCLHTFAEVLKNIPPQNVTIVATATLRCAVNRDGFIVRAEQILLCPIQVITGEEEANLIYTGATCQLPQLGQQGHYQRQLIIDIGGASTELIVGQQQKAKQLFSLPMGSATWLTRYFAEGQLTEQHFKRAEDAACQQLLPIVNPLIEHGWDTCLGASGIIQALKAISQTDNPSPICFELLQSIKQQVIHCGKLEHLYINGLYADQAAVFPSGLAILLSIFSLLKIQSIDVAHGALREGLMSLH